MGHVCGKVRYRSVCLQLQVKELADNMRTWRSGNAAVASEDDRRKAARIMLQNEIQSLEVRSAVCTLFAVCSSNSSPDQTRWPRQQLKLLTEHKVAEMVGDQQYAVGQILTAQMGPEGQVICNCYKYTVRMYFGFKLGCLVLSFGFGCTLVFFCLAICK